MRGVDRSGEERGRGLGRVMQCRHLSVYSDSNVMIL